MSVQYSIQKMVSDGTLSTIALGIQYLQRNDIYIRIAGDETPQSGAPSGYTWSFVNNTTLKILPVVPNGVEVVVYRRTDVDAMYNIYSQNAQFDEATIDENNQQLLYIAQEYLEQGIPGAGVDTIEFLRDDGTNTYYHIKRTDGSYSAEFTVPSTGSAARAFAREALRRSYAEAGYNLVDGSFEAGGTLVNANDVLLQESTGKAFSGSAGVVAAGTNPASGGFIDSSNDRVMTYKTVAEMIQWAPQLPLGSRVAWDDYFAAGDCGGGRGVIKSGSHTEDGGSIFSLGATKYIEAFLPTTVFSIKFGVKFDNDRASAALNTTRLQAWVDYIGTSHREGMLGFGVAWHNGITITKNTKIKGIKAQGPNFGPLATHVGSTLRNASLNNHCVVVDATGNPPHVGLNCVFEDFTVYGNRQLAGAVGGHNIVLRADTTGEVTFIEGCQFNRIQSLYAKEQGLSIEGTVFANDFSYCSFSWNGTHGVSRGELGGSPITNNFHGCKFFENLQWGVYNNGITMALSECNIAQNYAGGFLGQSGYVELINCDFEANANVAIETRNSSGAGILVVGGKIHKSPGFQPGMVGIRAAAGSSGGIVQGMFFANYSGSGDKIFQSTGGSLSEFSYRLQNVTTGQLTPTDMEAIERIPNLDKTYRGTIEFTGSGIGIRTATITVPTPFKTGFNVAGTVQRLAGINPAPGGMYMEPTARTLGSVQVYINVTSNVGSVFVDWIAAGR